MLDCVALFKDEASGKQCHMGPGVRQIFNLRPGSRAISHVTLGKLSNLSELFIWREQPLLPKDVVKISKIIYMKEHGHCPVILLAVDKCKLGK